MEKLNQFSVKIKNFKCFGEPEQGFEQIKPINLIIGKNNSGKTSLLDLIEFVVKNELSFQKSQWHNNKIPEIILEHPLNDAEIRNVFPTGSSGGELPGYHWEYGKQLVGKKIMWQLNPSNNGFISLDDRNMLPAPLSEYGGNYIERLAKIKSNPLAKGTFKRILAERDIAPEIDKPGDHTVFSDGRGVTNIIQNFINKANLPSELVEETLLNELNDIISPDGYFKRIVCQQIKGGKWEIYLEEDSKGMIPLSNSGSGIKTIIMVLVYMYLVPSVEGKNINQYIFGFEELENNIHPALLRRLLAYIDERSKNDKGLFFLTTHSSVAIDFFNKNPNAQIIHVTHNGNNASCRTVKTYIDNKDVLDDLDVRASDLLQSNGVLWVEGPSDRIYINKWIELWSSGELKEGTHYQCVFYGGRLLSHLSADSPDATESGISILRVNRNAILFIDSDKRHPQTPLNSTKKRIIKEIGDNKGMVWVTKGKEIENYIPVEAVEKFITSRKEISQVDKYENFFDYLDSLKSDVGKKYSSKKPLLAEKICQYLTKENISQVMDLQEQLDQVCERIRSWNT